MNTAVASICAALFFVVAPALVLAHFIWPRRVGWWLVAAASGGLGWLLLVLSEHFTKRAWDACEMTIVPGAMADSIGGCAIVDAFATYNLQFGWLKALIYLAPWAAVCGVVQLVQRRRTATAASLPNKSPKHTRGR